MDERGRKLQELDRDQLIIELLARAEERGFITFQELEEVFPRMEEDLPFLDDLWEELFARGIQVVSQEKATESAPGGAGVEPLELEEGVRDLDAVSASDTIGLYLTEMAQEPLLSAEEEIELAKQIERGRWAERKLRKNGRSAEEQARLRREVELGQAAREHLSRANTRLVVSIAKKYRGYGVPFPDLIQEGNVGLMRAVDKFDYRRGNRFSTYATWWIRQAITRALADQGRTIRLPVHMSDRIRKVYQVAHQLEQETGHRPTPEEIAREMAEDPDKIRWMISRSRRATSLERPVGDDDDGSELGDFIENENTPDPAESVARQLLAEQVRRMLEQLTPREARILRLRYGLADGRTRTLKEIAQQFGLSRERIRQIEREALDKLRPTSEALSLQEYLR